jgi:hypothetical protein
VGDRVHSPSGLQQLCRRRRIGESAFGAAVPLYYGLWYRRDEIAVRISWYIGGGSLSGA